VWDVIRFTLELATIAAVAHWGWVTGRGVWRAALAIVAVVAPFVVWGTWIAPRTPRRLDDPARMIVEAAVFACGVAALLATHHPVLAVALAVSASISMAITRAREVTPGSQ
jgi:hypothetical protein